MSAFVILAAGENEQRFACKEIMTIGRDAGNDIVLDDQHVSRRHAMICRLQDGDYYLIDEGSANGSLLNASRISLPTRINDGDQITIGPQTMRFEQRSAVARPAAQPDSRSTMMLTQQSVEVVKIAILVADIRGFTTLSESMAVRPLTELMNEWFRAVTGCIKERYGVIDKFLGDCVYARWSANGDESRAVLRAMDAACELNRLSSHINASHPDLPQPLGIGAGVNFGIAAIGTDQGHTAIGDTVNLTFRLQEQTRMLGTDILIADDAYKLFPESFWSGHEQRIKVKGKKQPVDVVGFSFDQAATLLRLDDDTRQRA